MSQNLPPPEVRTVNFTAPSAVDIQVIGSDAQTGQTFVNVGGPNQIQRIIFNSGNANQVGYIALYRDGKEVRRIPFTLMQSNQIGDYYPGFPINVRPGLIQFRIVFTAGTVTATTASVVWATSLVQVVS